MACIEIALQKGKRISIEWKTKKLNTWILWFVSATTFSISMLLEIKKSSNCFFSTILFFLRCLTIVTMTKLLGVSMAFLDFTGSLEPNGQNRHCPTQFADKICILNWVILSIQFLGSSTKATKKAYLPTQFSIASNPTGFTNWDSIDIDMAARFHSGLIKFIISGRFVLSKILFRIPSLSFRPFVCLSIHDSWVIPSRWCMSTLFWIFWSFFAYPLQSFEWFPSRWKF